MIATTETTGSCEPARRDRGTKTRGSQSAVAKRPDRDSDQTPSAALKLTLRRGAESDAASIAGLINRAYEVERFFVDGDRTSEAAVLELQRSDGYFLVLERSASTRDGYELGAAIYVRAKGDRGYFGLLSVAQELQGGGLGRRMIAVAEALCEADGCTDMDMQVVNLRTELQPWYRSLGYRECGTEPFPESESPKQPCHFVLMEKQISPHRYI